MNDSPKATAAPTPWKILIADDDEDVHQVTRLALRGASFQGRALEFIDAYSGAETLSVLRDNPDIAVVFLDVIMETEDAGLRAARSIRANGFDLVRIIIRTGFPGQAPESKVSVDYDIHDYKEKSGLSVQALFTSVISALRAYKDLVALESHRRGLLSVLESVSSFDFNAVQRYVARMLAEFINLARLDSESLVVVWRPSARPQDVPTVVASLGDWPGDGEQVPMADLPIATTALIRDSLDRRQGLAGTDSKTLFFRHAGVDLVILAAGSGAFAKADDVLLEVFLLNVCQAIGSQQSYADMAGDRDAVLRGLALRAEGWDEDAAAGLERLAWLASAIAARLHTRMIFPDQIDDRFMRDIGVAAMLHDIGNESLPAGLLTMPATYAPAERMRMQMHVTAGSGVLELFIGGRRNTGALSLARDVVAGHHERYDGSGYPGGLSGDAIPLAARLVAVADAHTAMTGRRPHRPAMESSSAIEAIKAEAGKQFDPRIVEAFVEVMDSPFGE